MTVPARKIGVLTFHRCINYGSYWQARCLAEGLRGYSAEPELLEHESAQVTRAEWRCAFQPLLPRRTAREDLPRYGAKARKFLAAFDRLPRSRPFPLDRPEELGPQEMVIVGSDEVWNLQHPWYGGKPIFYGEGLSTARLVSYAASFGNHDASAGLGPDWARSLDRFDAISVRDENSRALVREATGRDPALVLDPVLQFPPEAEPGAAEAPYLAVYGHSFPRWYAEAVRRWAGQARLRLLSIGYRNEWADAHLIEAGPEDFARLIAGAAAVATNFFHGCVFALANARPFVCVGSAYRSNKLRDLTHGLGAARHLVDEETGPERIPDLLATPLDPAIPARIAELRARSDAYLRHALA
ncbi:MAG TPA: polysaccharide pyruvyl transferase family protein [Sphingomonas sp.]|nr:polysaccharide pyruvyl transferase family protein [Sphingomonas sp.]